MKRRRKELKGIKGDQESIREPGIKGIITKVERTRPTARTPTRNQDSIRGSVEMIFSEELGEEDPAGGYRGGDKTPAGEVLNKYRIHLRPQG
jgi:hypothetical protein